MRFPRRTPDVENLYARIGTMAPNLVFAGHTDVVSPGDEARWTHPPFAGDVADGQLWGRGAVDMKVRDRLLRRRRPRSCGAQWRAEGLDLAADHRRRGRPGGLTARQNCSTGRRRAAKTFDHCLVGEPSNDTVLGDMVKVGRRGSLNGTLVVTGRQGHVAYPQRADNPIRGLVTLMSRLMAEPLDHGTAYFDPSNLEFTSVDVGNRTVNLIPAEARARFNIRFNDRHTQDSLEHLIEKRTAEAAGDRTRWRLDFDPSNCDVFRTEPGPFVDLVAAAVADVTGQRPALSTTGGTSDARFIKNACPVVELGLVGQLAHHVDERVPVADLEHLTRIYRHILEHFPVAPTIGHGPRSAVHRERPRFIDRSSREPVSSHGEIHRGQA